MKARGRKGKHSARSGSESTGAGSQQGPYGHADDQGYYDDGYADDQAYYDDQPDGEYPDDGYYEDDGYYDDGYGYEDQGYAPETSRSGDPYDRDFLEGDYKKPKARKRRGAWGGILLRLATIGVVFLVLWFYTGGDLLSLILPQEQRVVPESTEFVVMKQVTFTSTTPHGSFEYDMFLPVNITNSQTIHNVATDPPPNEYPTVGNPNHVEWNHSLGLGEQFVINITYTASSKTRKFDMSSSKSGTVNDIPQDLVDTYIPDNVTELDDSDVEVYGRNGQQYWNDDAGEWTIDPMNQEVTRLAENLTKGKVTVYDKAKAVFDWIRSVKRYSRGDDLKTCSEILESKVGDCDDQSVLFISITRALGIPSWLQLGILYDPIQKIWFGHGWAQVAIPKSSGGHIVGDVDLVNDLFLVRDPYRVIEWTDNGDGDVLEEYYTWSKHGSTQDSIEYRTLAFRDHGEVNLDDDNGIPGFSSAMVAPAVLAAIFIFRKRVK